ncbi:MAG: M28 family peptidase [Phycisphaeraceae bacterium]|nr:M28 family peptidase [Phycisphaeraceae bacterium]
MHLLLAIPLLLALPAGDGSPTDAIRARIEALNAIPTRDSLLSFHEMLCSEPHIAGTDGDHRNADRIAEAFRAMGLEVEKQEIWVYLCRPLAASLDIVSPQAVSLGLKEDSLTEDKFSQNPELLPGWNAYSGSGEVTAGVVYANYGTKADFEKLKSLGVDCAGKIVLARYGGNYRGYKARFAQDAGAAGLVIFTDPADAGYCKGIMYPEGGYANDTCIQRGSLNTLPYEGDPLTPFIPATKDAPRLSEDSLDLPTIPVQPIGFGAAKEILSRMTGPAVPAGWQGGLPLAYRLTGGDSLTVHLKIQQERFLAKTYNITAMLRGSDFPDQLVLAGAHHDAWGYGATDPSCGTITVLESARCFTQAIAGGQPRPLRSIVFCCWGAEEFGLIGSVEWVEAHRESLAANAVAYLNLDMASTGLEFDAAASPPLRRVIAEAAKSVPQPGGSAGQTVYDAWIARARDEADPALPRTGDIGGGSDHVGFNCHLGVPVAGMSASGSKGNSYHSNYDNLIWYWKVVGDDYASATLVTRMTNATLALLAYSPVIPYDRERAGTDTIRYLGEISRIGIASGFLSPQDPPSPRGIAAELAPLEAAAERYRASSRRLDPQALGTDPALANAELIGAEREWLTEAGLPGRPWFRSLLAGTDEDSGYASWMLPSLRYAVEHRDRSALDRAIAELAAVFDRLEARLTAGAPSGTPTDAIPPPRAAPSDHQTLPRGER